LGSGATILRSYPTRKRASKHWVFSTVLLKDRAFEKLTGDRTFLGSLTRKIFRSSNGENVRVKSKRDLKGKRSTAWL